MIKKLNSLFFELEDGENIGDGILFYIATFGCLFVAIFLKIITFIN